MRFLLGLIAGVVGSWSAAELIPIVEVTVDLSALSVDLASLI